MLGQHGRGLTKALFTTPALAMAKIGITPNMLTVTGTIASVAVAVATLPQGHFILGPVLAALVLVADSFDGILARATGRTSVFGAFLDSTLDRLADGAVFASLAAWAGLHLPEGTQRTLTLGAALACVVLAAAVPYARARAESVGATASIGIAERTDRLVVALLATFMVGLGAPAWVLTAALVLVAAASLITVVQRVLTVRSQLLARGDGREGQPDQEHQR
ncbi:MAG: CDP-alcohol phosphatidyltransferase family protein [Actinomyces urogenitalis]|uniref:phosphatidylinositol phosphate synthase n=1 Tax=Actinomyces urogenitalis TaxID=103621 RepID=UPI002A7F424D|nr:CDP-alcohol phosphatidyltransferase family protein [Actinomyces urogenitalis]MDY3678864.1 CDP-alcohol phosphatidyltransferase family protein [Actinomyces urogenitalis]